MRDIIVDFNNSNDKIGIAELLNTNNPIKGVILCYDKNNKCVGFIFHDYRYEDGESYNEWVFCDNIDTDSSSRASNLIELARYLMVENNIVNHLKLLDFGTN